MNYTTKRLGASPQTPWSCMILTFLERQLGEIGMEILDILQNEPRKDDQMLMSKGGEWNLVI